VFVVAFPAFFALNEACPVPVIVLQKVGAMLFRGMEISRCATLASGICLHLLKNRAICVVQIKAG
jgi:hypothetical protein